MRRMSLLPLLAAGAALPASAQTPAVVSSPGEIISAAPAADWVDIAADDLLVMTLAPDARGKDRQVIMQLMPPPLSQGWVDNIRALARAHWYDGNAIYRVQDNYVTQWGDPDADGKKAKPLPTGLKTMSERDYVVPYGGKDGLGFRAEAAGAFAEAAADAVTAVVAAQARNNAREQLRPKKRDAYADLTVIAKGWPLASNSGSDGAFWPVHCYGTVGVSRGARPDTGDGTSLYAVNGHAPRHLDRNIAVVGRIIEGMAYLSALPRGTDALGFYKDVADYVPILSVRLASELPAAQQPHIQYLSTESASFAKYADARANRRDPFFLVPAGGADICNIPVPTRRKP